MKIVPVEHDLQLAVSSIPRSSGLHVSDIYGDLFSALEPNRYSRKTVLNPTKMAVGLAWETYLESLLQRQGILAWRPGEFLSPEGIYYSPDLIVEVDGVDRIGEIKATWYSSQTTLTDSKIDKWIVQVKAYCYWTGIPRARFYCLFLNGDYRNSREPILKVWDIDFSPQELRENITMLLNHARNVGMLE